MGRLAQSVVFDDDNKRGTYGIQPNVNGTFFFYRQKIVPEIPMPPAVKMEDNRDIYCMIAALYQWEGTRILSDM